jgi:hypothetical protein
MNNVRPFVFYIPWRIEVFIICVYILCLTQKLTNAKTILKQADEI